MKNSVHGGLFNAFIWIYAYRLRACCILVVLSKFD